MLISCRGWWHVVHTNPKIYCTWYASICTGLQMHDWGNTPGGNDQNQSSYLQILANPEKNNFLKKRNWQCLPSWIHRLTGTMCPQNETREMLKTKTSIIQYGLGIEKRRSFDGIIQNQSFLASLFDYLRWISTRWNDD